ncbi:phosphotransacetylase [Mycoplasma sp. SG1]|uniref:phosphotransacetylase n=1 Tax=Mycoplasma sp. SG1 TaxID=2810348 RepID=UPI0020249D42|nr:phosphotransacetylase [Mycoplasma sp. SG1]URM52838.1 phosphotransacetylase [Mycoplasma sp. SG1]
MLLEFIKELKGKNIRIIFPEGNDKRVLKACTLLKKSQIIEPVLVGDTDEINQICWKEKILENFEILDPKTFQNKEKMIENVFNIRKGKQTKEEITNWFNKHNYFATMCLNEGLVDGLVGGATYSTADTVRPALQIIGCHDKLVSSFMILEKNNQFLFFTDCAIIPSPTSEQLVILTKRLGNKIKNFFKMTPNIALLSFSTNKSASSPSVEVVQKAVIDLKKEHVGFAWDGEMQFDAALSVTVRNQKFSNSKLEPKPANGFVFPNLESANIGYKIAQRLGDWNVIGPVLQGLKKPINDLSRGCDDKEIFNTTILTAYQALLAKEKK